MENNPELNEDESQIKNDLETLPILSLCPTCYHIPIIAYFNGILYIDCRNCKKRYEIPDITYIKKMIQFTKEKNSKILQKSFYEKCAAHDNLFNKYYCSDCSKNICEKCKYKHMNHFIIPLEGYIQKFKVSNVDEKKAKLKERYEFILKHSNEIKEKILGTLTEENDKNEIGEKYKIFENKNTKLYQIGNIIIDTYSSNIFESIYNVLRNISFYKDLNGDASTKDDLIKYFDTNSIVEFKNIWINEDIFLIRQNKLRNINEFKQINQKDPNALINKGRCLVLNRKYDEALMLFNKAIEIDPKNDVNYRYNGKCLFEMKKFGDALKIFDKAICLQPNNSEYYDLKGNCLFEIKKYDKALVQFDKAITLSPFDIYYLEDKRRCMEKLNKN